MTTGASSSVVVAELDVQRFCGARARYGWRFLRRSFSEEELSSCLPSRRADERLGARFAARVALRAALRRVGVRASVTPRTAVVERGPGGAPRFGLARSLQRELAAPPELSLTHDRGLAAACVLVRRPAGGL